MEWLEIKSFSPGPTGTSFEIKGKLTSYYWSTIEIVYLARGATRPGKQGNERSFPHSERANKMAQRVALGLQA